MVVARAPATKAARSASAKAENPMNGRPDREGMTGRGPRLGRSPWALYLTTGAVLAVLRVALYAWLTHRAATDTVLDVDRYLVEWVFYPELLFLDYVPLPIANSSMTVVDIVLGTLVALVSFILALPILPLGWLWRRRRQHAGR